MSQEKTQPLERESPKSTGTPMSPGCSSAGSSLPSLQPRWMSPHREQGDPKAGASPRGQREWNKPLVQEACGCGRAKHCGLLGGTATWPHGHDREPGKEGGKEGEGAARGHRTATALGGGRRPGWPRLGPAHHHRWGTAHAPTHPRSQRGNGTARGRCGLPSLRLLQCATRPHRRRPGRGLCTDPRPSRCCSSSSNTTPAPRPPQPVGRVGGHSHGRAGGNRGS